MGKLCSLKYVKFIVKYNFLSKSHCIPWHIQAISFLAEIYEENHSVFLSQNSP